MENKNDEEKSFYRSFSRFQFFFSAFFFLAFDVILLSCHLKWMKICAVDFSISSESHIQPNTLSLSLAHTRIHTNGKCNRVSFSSCLKYKADVKSAFALSDKKRHKRKRESTANRCAYTQNKFATKAREKNEFSVY